MIGSPYTDKETTCYVDNDNFKAGYDATKFLLDKGATRIVYAHTNLAEKVQNARYKGYLAALSAADSAELPLCLSTVRDDEIKNAQALGQMMAETGGKVGIVACDDILAIEIQHLCDICEIEQSELALLGFNNSLLAKTARPALTSVEIFPRFLGSEAAALAINTKENDNLKLETNHVVVPHKIVERASTKI